MNNHSSDLKTEFIRSSFQWEVIDVWDEVQEEFLQLKFNSTPMEDFEELALETYWIK